MNRRQMGYFRNLHKDEEPLGIVCHRHGWNYRKVKALYDDGSLEGVQHPGGGWFLTTTQTRALAAYASRDPEVRLDPPARP